MAAKGNSAPAIKRDGAAPLRIVMRAIDELVPYAANARTHPPAQVAQIAASIKEFGFITPCVVDKNDVLIAGHGRVMGAKELGMKEVPTLAAEHLTEAQVKAFRLADNKIALNADWLDELLRDELHVLQGLDFDLSLTGFDESEIAKLLGMDAAAGAGDGSGKNMLADKFMIPPFSVLNAREGWWQDRKRAWLALGIQSEVGRGDVMPSGSSSWSGTRGAKRAAPGGNHMPATDYSKSGKKGDGRGKAIG